MTSDLLDTGTWRRDRGCASWRYLVGTGQSVPAAMANCAGQLLAILPGFAVVAAAEWTTESAGEDTLAQPRGTTIDRDVVAATLRDYPDTTELDLELDLELLASDGVTPARLADGALLNVEREASKLWIMISLNVDIYARLTWGDVRDNSALARVNGPLLTAFLARIRGVTGGQFQSVDAENYGDQAFEHGFH